jgi:hypothetical protein
MGLNFVLVNSTNDKKMRELLKLMLIKQVRVIRLRIDIRVKVI